MGRKTITVRANGHGYEAVYEEKGQTVHSETGATKEEAIGKLVRNHASLFSVSITIEL